MTTISVDQDCWAPERNICAGERNICLNYSPTEPHIARSVFYTVRNVTSCPAEAKYLTSSAEAPRLAPHRKILKVSCNPKPWRVVKFTGVTER